MDTVMARKMWRTLEPYHGLVYFAPEATAAYEALGVVGQDGYFASRAAPMGAVSAEVVVATFFNFDPALVRRALPSVWDRTTPAAMLDARLGGIDAALRRIIGDAIGSAEVARAAELARAACEGGTAAGRPLYAAHAGLPWPDPPHLSLWHAITLLRELRGDGHVASLVDAEIGPVDALVLHAATGELARAVLQGTRGWSDGAWAASIDGLRARGLLEADGSFTADGAALRQRIEDRTDALAMGPWLALGEDGCDELRGLVRPLSRAAVESGAFGRPPQPSAAEHGADAGPAAMGHDVDRPVTPGTGEKPS